MGAGRGLSLRNAVQAKCRDGFRTAVYFSVGNAHEYCGGISRSPSIASIHGLISGDHLTPVTLAVLRRFRERDGDVLSGLRVLTKSRLVECVDLISGGIAVVRLGPVGWDTW